MNSSVPERAGRVPSRPRPLVLGLVVLALLVAVAFAFRTPPVAQPVAFNHLNHTTDLKLDCLFCHKFVNKREHAGLPDARVCGSCHLDRAGKSAESRRVTALLTAGTPLRFNKLVRLPSHVYFSHRRHVAIGQLKCAQCHGDIATSVVPPSRPLVQIKMKVCLDCHQAKSQSLDCVACHR